MEQELQTLNTNIVTIDSIEISKMLETPHSKIIRKLEGDKTHKGIIPVLTEAQMGVSDYFMESSYKDDSGKENKCYLITRLGCDFIANKFTGEKGILFTAKYVKKFNEMENKIKQQEQYKLPQTYKEALLQLVEQVELNENLQIENKTLSLENKLLNKEEFKWADSSLINALVRRYGSCTGEFGKAWTEFKKSLLYSYSININSRITAYLNSTGKRTKPKTLSMLKTKEEISSGIATILSMCKEKDIDVSEILKHYSESI